MPDFLILKLEGVMQAWGGHTFEDLRPSHDFPTRSGLIGLLGACLGLNRQDREGQTRLSLSIRFAVRVDRKQLEWEEYGQKRTKILQPIKMTDYHTIREARRANRLPKEGETVQSWREYLYDIAFTVAIGQTENASVTLVKLCEPVQRPVFTPFLGRRACPLTRPLLHGIVQADSLFSALAQVEPPGGRIYSEEDGNNLPKMLIRDVPLWREHRQFATRQVYIHASKELS
ncbi:MAG: type I-E CRISPR-associated protein Cas5/CasD [Gammaproteobacteria bacterium]